MILASASPRRSELLTQARLKFEVEPSHLNEDALPDEAAAAYVQRLAIEKAQAVCALHRGDTEAFIVLAADTCVVLEGEILGKPATAADAVRMLTLLSGRTHAVMTGVAAVTPGRMVAGVEITQVFFDVVLPEEIEAYVATGEPLDKAGAYGIQGYAARWIPRIEGDYGNVVGLPIARVVRMLEELQLNPDEQHGA